MTEKDNSSKPQSSQIVNYQLTISIPRGVKKSKYDVQVIEPFELWCKTHCRNWVFQIEETVTPEGLNPHIQASIRLKNKLRLLHLVDILFKDLTPQFLMYEFWKKSCVNVSPTVVWNQQSMNYKYCTKVDTRIAGPFMDPTFFKPSPITNLNRQWQRLILEILKQQPDSRTIYNVIDVTGGCGKTTFQKQFYAGFPGDVGLIDFSGNIGQVIASTVNQGPRKTYFCNLPWSLPHRNREDRMLELCQALESIKDGFITSSFYGRGETLCFNCPHVIVFSNWSILDNGGNLADDRVIELHINQNGDNLSAIKRHEKGLPHWMEGHVITKIINEDPKDPVKEKEEDSSRA